MGTVKDTTGGTVAGANVTVTNVETGLNRSQSTGDDGSYRFPALPVGNYSVRVEKEGFEVMQRTGVTLVVGQEAVIDATLQVGATGQTVTVTGEAPQVDTTSSSLGGVVNEDKIADLPLNGRNYVDLTILQPGITQSALTFAGSISPLGVTGTTFSSNGAPLRSNLQMLDGAIMSNVIGLNSTSVIGTTLGVDGIKEYKVVTSMFSAEYGLVIGSQTTLVSKGGTNQFHGDAFEYLRNSALDARNYFDQLDSKNFNGFGTDKSLPFPGKRIPPFVRNNFGGSFRGPIRKDKTFFYGVYEGLRLAQAPPIQATTFNKGCFYGSNTSPTGPFTLNNGIPKFIDNDPTTNPYSIFIGTPAKNTACTTPASVNGIQNNLITVGCPFRYITATGCSQPLNPAVLGAADAYWPVPNVAYGLNSAGQPAQVLSYNYTWPYRQPQNENYMQLRMDQIFNDKDSLFGRYTADLSNQTSPESFPQWSLKYKSQGLLATVSETHILSPTVLNTARVSYSRSGLNFIDITVPLVVDAELIPGQGFACCSVGNGVSTPSTSNTPGDIYQNIFTLSDDIFWTKGKHAFKFGALVNHFQTLLDLQFTTKGGATFSNNQNFFAGDYASLSYGAFQAGYGVERIYNYNTVGFYAQDDYRVTPRLTLNLGMRYETMTTPTAPPGFSFTVRDPKSSPAGTPDPPFLNPGRDAISPRLGFAWDVFGDGKTSLRGGTGIYYDIGNTGNLFASNATGGPPLTNNHSFTNNAYGGVSGTGAPNQPDFPANLAFTYGRFGTYPLLNPANQSVSLGLTSVRTIEYHLKLPTMAQWNLTLDRQLPWGMALTIAYVGNHGWHQTQLIEGNNTIPTGMGANGLPTYGCYINTAYGFSLPGNQTQPVNAATGACPTGFTQNGPKTNQNCLVNIAPITSAPNMVQGPCWSTGLSSMNGGDTTYNGLQVGLNKRVTHGLQMQFNYTWSHSLDDCVKTILDVDSTSSCQAPQADLFEDKGASYNDIRHNIRTNVIYHFPDLKSEALWAKPLHGWWAGTIVSWQTGYPMTPVNGVGHNLSGNVDTVDRPNLDPSFNPNTVVTGNPAQWFNPTMFDLQPAGTFGNAGKAIFRGPKLANADININKDTKLKWLGENGSLQFRAELFNILNHPNYAAPSGTLTLQNSISSTAAASTPVGQYGTGALAISPTAGAITRTTTKSRQIQVALKVVF